MRSYDIPDHFGIDPPDRNDEGEEPRQEPALEELQALNREFDEVLQLPETSQRELLETILAIKKGLLAACTKETVDGFAVDSKMFEGAILHALKELRSQIEEFPFHPSRSFRD